MGSLFIPESLKNKKIKIVLVLFGISILGILLRTICLNKVGGFWYDEAVIYHQASQSFPFGIINDCIKNDVHFPLYQMLLHCWMSIFGNNDIVLRALSVVFGVLTIPVMYFAGKELSDHKTGLVAAVMTALNSFLIYYSQEVKFYALLALLASVSLLSLIKLSKEINWKNFNLFLVASIGMIYTFTIGMMFVVLEIIFFAAGLYFYKREDFKKFLMHLLKTSFVLIPLCYFAFTSMQTENTDFTGGFSTFHFDFSFIIVLLQTWFTPFLIGTINNPANYFHFFMKCLSNPFFVILAVIPLGINLTGLYLGLKSKNKIILPLFLTSISFIVVQIILSYFTTFKIMSRYVIISLPFLILIVSFGLTMIKNKKIFKTALGSFIALNLFFIVVSPTSAPKQQRPEQYASLARLLNLNGLKKGDVVVHQLRPYLTEKYMENNALNLSINYLYYADKKGLKTLISDKSADKINTSNCHKLLKPYFVQNVPSLAFKDYTYKAIFDKVQHGRYLVIVVNRNFIYSSKSRMLILKNPQVYEKSSILSMLLSKTINDMLALTDSEFNLVKVEKNSNWVVYFFKRDK